MSSVSTGAASIGKKTTTSAPRFSSTVTWPSIDHEVDSPPFSTSVKCSGRTPRITRRGSFCASAPSSVSGSEKPAKRSDPSETSASTRFIDGEPMNAATNRFAGDQ